MYCDHCGAENQQDAKKCFACQRSLDLATGPLDDDSLVPTSSTINGSLLRGRYRILERIGQGGFGSVYKAQDTHSNNNNLVAVKQIDMGELKPQEIIEATDAFNREVQLLSYLRHPHLPRMHTYFTDTRHWYLVMDFIAGDTLERYLELASKGSKHGIQLEDVLDIGMQLCTVLHYMHMHNPIVIFRDLKPSNVMLVPGPGRRVYLIDFGIARIFKPGQAKDTMAFGSPGYAAPEQYGKAQTTPRADIYSLGAILHQMLTGKDPSDTPFHFAPIGSSHPMLPHELDQLIMSMLDMDPQRRPVSMAWVKQALEVIANTNKQASGRPGYTGGYAAVSPMHSRLSGNNSIPTGSKYYQPPLTYPGSSGPQYGQVGQSMMPPQQSAPARQGKSRVSRRAAVGIVGGVLVATMICANAGKSSYSSGAQNSPYPPVQPTADTASLSLVNQYSLHAAAINSLAWSQDTTNVASASADKTVQVWNFTDSRNITTYRKHTQAVTAVAWGSTGDRIASGSLDKTVHIWDAEKGTTRQQRTYPAPVTAVSWAPDGTALFVGCADGTIYLCDTATLRTKATLKGHTDSIRALECTESYLASASADYTVKVWDWKNNNLMITYEGHSNVVNALAWSPDGQKIASASNDRSVQTWNALDGSGSYTYTGHITNGTATADVDLSKAIPAQVYAVAWEPSGVHIASGGSNGMLQVWSAADGTLVASDLSTNQSIRSIVWVSNAPNTYIVYGGDNHTAITLQVE